MSNARLYVDGGLYEVCEFKGCVEGWMKEFHENKQATLISN